MSIVETKRIFKDPRANFGDNRVVRVPISKRKPITPAHKKAAGMSDFSDWVSQETRAEMEKVIKEQKNEQARKIAMREARETLKERLGMNHDEAFAFIGIYGPDMVAGLVEWFEVIPSYIRYGRIMRVALDAIMKGRIDIRFPKPSFASDWRQALMAIIFICESFAPEIKSENVPVSHSYAEAKKAEA